jgi:hypothetical protein
MDSIEELEQRYAEAHREWQQNPGPETERAVERAADTLRRARRGQWAADGVTNAELSEGFSDGADNEEEA